MNYITKSVFQSKKLRNFKEFIQIFKTVAEHLPRLCGARYENRWSRRFQHYYCKLAKVKHIAPHDKSTKNTVLTKIIFFTYEKWNGYHTLTFFFTNGSQSFRSYDPFRRCTINPHTSENECFKSRNLWKRRIWSCYYQSIGYSQYCHE